MTTKPIRPCQAKNPSTCSYHGVPLRMKAALAKGDLSEYMTAKGELEKAAATKSAATKQVNSGFSPTTEINYLNLDEDDTSYSWGERYKIKAAKMVARDGKPLMKDADQYGWVDQSSLAHFRAGKNQCHIAEITSIEEDEWDQFENTFADNSEHLGVQAEAQCACGWFRGKIRAEGTLGELVASMRSNI